MTQESISVVFTGIAGTPAYHGTLFYVDASGAKFYAGGTYQNYPVMLDAHTQGDLINILGAETRASTPYGNLIAISGSVSSADENLQIYGSSWFSAGNPSVTLATGSNLSGQWGVILNAMEQINDLNLSYAPITQNSNSAWCTAVQAAGISLPTGIELAGPNWVPGCLNTLPTSFTPPGQPSAFPEIMSSAQGLDADGNPTATITVVNSSGFITNSVVVGGSNSTRTAYEEVTSVSANQTAITISGIGAQVSVSNAAITIADDALAAIQGSGNVINAGAGATIDLQGSANVFASGPDGTVTIENTSVGSQLDHITMTDGNVFVGANAGVTLSGNGDNISVQGNTNVAIDGAGNVINVSGQSAVVSETGSANTLNVFGISDVSIAEGVGTKINVSGWKDNTTVNGQGDTTAVTGNGDNQTTVSGTSDVTTVTGDWNQTTIAGWKDATSITGQGDGTTVTGSGDDNTTVLGTSDATVVTGAWNQTTIAGWKDGTTITGQGDGTTVTGSGDDDTSVSGTSDITVVNGNWNQTSIAGWQDTTFVGGQGDGTTVTGSGNDATYVSGISDESVVTGSWDQTYISGWKDGSAIVGQGDVTVVTGSGDDDTNVIGEGDSTTVSGSWDQTGIGGWQDTTFIEGQGNGTSVTGSGSDNTYVSGAGDVTTVSGSWNQTVINGTSDSTWTSGQGDGTTVNGSGGDNTVDSGIADSVMVTGNGDQTSSSGADDTYSIQGQDDGSTPGSVVTLPAVDAPGAVGGSGEFTGGNGAGGIMVVPPSPGDELTEDPDIEDPVILNLTGAAVQATTLTGSNTYFDMQNNGQFVHTTWATAGEGMLVYDPTNPDAAVTQDAQLVSGFDVLKRLDSNGDGQLDANDAAWSDLRVWVDDAGTGQFESGAVYSLTRLGISSIDLNATRVNQSSNGNTILDDSKFTWTDGAKGDIAGVDLTFDSAQQPSTLSTTQVAAITQMNQLVSAMAAFVPPASALTGVPASNAAQLQAPLLAASH